MAQFLNNGAYPTYQETQAMINGNALTVKEASGIIDTAIAKEAAIRKAEDNILDAKIKDIGGDGSISALRSELEAQIKILAQALNSITKVYSNSWEATYGTKGLKKSISDESDNWSNLDTHQFRTEIAANTLTKLNYDTIYTQPGSHQAFVRLYVIDENTDTSTEDTTAATCMSSFDVPAYCEIGYNVKNYQVKRYIQVPVAIPANTVYQIYYVNDK